MAFGTTTRAGRECEELVAPTEEDVAQDSEVLIDDGGEEAEPVKHAADPGRPTAK